MGEGVGADAPDAQRASARRGGRILVDALRIHGVDRIFCVPGESYLEVLDALHDTPEIDLVVCRHEGAAANMAEADGKLTARPGICFVTRGPGATHASVGVHTAFHDSTPMVLFVGQVERGFRGREAFQEIDVAQVFAPLAKWTAEIDSAARIPELVARAFHVATSGRNGPVVLSLPEDVLSEAVSVADIEPRAANRSAPLAGDIESAAREIEAARHPVVIVGGSGWDEKAAADLMAFADRNSLPVVSSFRRQDVFDNRHPNYAGHLSPATSRPLAARLQEADLVIALGTRLGDVTTSGYTLMRAPRSTQRLVHAHPDPHEIGRVYDADVALVGEIGQVVAALRALPPMAKPAWRARVAELRREYIDSIDPAGAPVEHPVNLAGIVAHLDRNLAERSIVTSGAGNYTIWVHRFYRYRALRTELAPTSGAMGYGLPAAVAAKLRHPDRTVVCFAGDGCFMMYPQEFATAVERNAAIIVLVVNNGTFGTIRMHQERRFPRRVSGTGIANPDFVALARSLGGHAERVERTEDFPPAFLRAVDAGRPALIEIRVDPRQLTPNFRLGA
jgi:acetolactate synthase-1/2/3 large subunit